MLTELQHDVEARADRGEPLERIEAEVVEPAPVDDERRAALWLLAWHRTERMADRRLGVPEADRAMTLP